MAWSKQNFLACRFITDVHFFCRDTMVTGLQSRFLTLATRQRFLQIQDGSLRAF